MPWAPASVRLGHPRMNGGRVDALEPQFIGHFTIPTPVTTWYPIPFLTQ